MEGWSSNNTDKLSVWASLENMESHMGVLIDCYIQPTSKRKDELRRPYLVLTVEWCNKSRDEHLHVLHSRNDLLKAVFQTYTSIGLCT